MLTNILGVLSAKFRKKFHYLVTNQPIQTKLSVGYIIIYNKVLLFCILGPLDRDGTLPDRSLIRVYVKLDILSISLMVKPLCSNFSTVTAIVLVQIFRYFYHMSHVMRKLNAICEQQKCRSSMQSDQHLCYSLHR